ncbi:MAG: hypothetical protein HC916_06840 [Coleofasciculaceae cyanobacterium SM2_1_6]|nr:hypothetical protein [Coleofasciculaceae cyanobacterium SM2_1_6]
MTIHTDLSHLFVDLDESAMESASGGVSNVFLDRWAAKFVAGNANLARVSQRLVNAYYQGALTVTSVTNWSATTAVGNRVTWNFAAPIVSNYVASGAPIAGATAPAINAVQSYLLLLQ